MSKHYDIFLERVWALIGGGASFRGGSIIGEGLVLWNNWLTGIAVTYKCTHGLFLSVISILLIEWYLIIVGHFVRRHVY